MENLVFRIKGFFWGLSFHRLYNHSKWLDLLIDKVIYLIDNCEDVNIDIDEYYITIRTSNDVIKFWNENKYYAWLSSGSINGVGFLNISPSKISMYRLKCKLFSTKNDRLHKKSYYDIDLISCQ